MEVYDLDEIQSLQDQVRHKAQCARKNLIALSTYPMEALYTLKFEQYGYHPLEDRPLNLIEQLNQTFTIMASLAAAKYIIEWFPQSGGLRLNLGAASGRDIESINKDVVEAEVFSAVNHKNASKLNKDIERLASSSATNRYVFFHAPSYNPGRRLDLEKPDSKVKVWVLRLQEII